MIVNTLLYTFIGSALFTIFATGPLVSFFRKIGIYQEIREDDLPNHKEKTKTPNMGGIIILVSLIVSTFLFWNEPKILSTIIAVSCFAILGFIDDYLSIKRQKPLGLKARYKLSIQIFLSAVFLYTIVRLGICDLSVSIPFYKGRLDLGYLYFPFAALFISGMANAVNITDGLDGLASGITAIVAISSIFVSSFIKSFPDFAVVPAAVSGTCVGFLWYNTYPAKVFLGDTGSLALGASLAIISVIGKSEVWMLLIGGVFIIELLSVVLQVTYFRLSGGKRIFKVSPLHHHFERSGWKEPKIVTRFWIAAVIFSTIGVILHGV